MSDHVWSGDKKRRAISSNDLKMRLDINRKSQSKNFHDWLRKRLNVQPSEQILDVGCGTGAQTFFMAEDGGEDGHVTALDISEESIKYLKNSLPLHLKSRVSAHVLDMGEIKEFLTKNYNSKKYTLAQSSYALYYSPKRINVLTEMQKRTRSLGRVAIFTPCPPHGMISLVEKHHKISEPVNDSLHFGDDFLRPLFRKSFHEIQVHYFQSTVSIKSLEEFKTFYEATTYFNEKDNESLYDEAENIIKNKNELNFEKCGILLIGSGIKNYCNEIF